METPKNKIRSESGASITFALLIFLVCAVVSAAVIVAASAAAGRISKTTEIDQRYYTVTSAAELLIDMLDDGEGVAKTYTQEITTTTHYSKDNKIIEDADNPKTREGKIKGSNDSSSSDSGKEIQNFLAQTLADDYVSDHWPEDVTDETDDADDSDNTSKPEPVSWPVPPKTLKLDVKAQDSEETANVPDMSAEIILYLSEDGSIKAYVRNDITNSSDNGLYTLCLTFYPDIVEAIDDGPVQKGTPQDFDDEGSFTVTDKSIREYTLEYKWRFADIQTLTGPREDLLGG